MHTHRKEFSIVKMCKVLGVSKSGYYKWRQLQEQLESEKEKLKREIKQKICKSFHESEGTYGSPRVHKDLVEWGYTISKKTVGRYMKKLGLKASPEGKYIVTTTDSNHDLKVYPDLLQRDFKVEEPDRVWVSDITYVRTLEGWVYLASIMDLFSRKIVGWSMDKHMKKDLTIKALNMAFINRNPSENLIHHSDRGSQYCSKDYVDLLQSKDCKLSMSRKGDPYDNACIESFHATIKKEHIYRRRFKTREEAIKSINYYISSRYNTNRKHSTLGYFSPSQFESNYYLFGSQNVS
ncbi:IS3 family transposase [Evansella halocellulosilytica]|uniref:IS3 family transposase n=1 Tax=Evansella halocellulosilytica TaxID=2011013 RepID=UPI00211C124E|nr:IS3 family transposase [Evansella halocellulosilytica]